MKRFTDPISERGGRGGGERDRQIETARERDRQTDREEDQIERFHQDRKCVSYLHQKPTLNIFTPDG